MARESDELIKRRIESDAEMQKRNEQAIAAEKRSLDKLHAFAGQAPGEKQQQTREASRTAVAEHEAAQGKAIKQQEKEQKALQERVQENKRITPVQENKGADSLEGVPLTDAARRKAIELNLTADDFKRRKKSGNDGEYTVADVERIAGAD